MSRGLIYLPEIEAAVVQFSQRKEACKTLMLWLVPSEGNATLRHMQMGPSSSKTTLREAHSLLRDHSHQIKKYRY